MYKRCNIASAIVLILSVGTAGAACTHTVPEVSSDLPAGSRYLLLPSDLGNAKADNVYDAIAKLRPEFLRGHGEPTGFVNQDIGETSRGGGTLPVAASAGVATVGALQPVIAYHDDVRLGSIDDLRSLTLSNVAEIRYIPAAQAAVKYGTNHAGGVIVVKSK